MIRLLKAELLVVVEQVDEGDPVVDCVDSPTEASCEAY
jgi:hypothetical protein